jgi:hypothetical protein
MTAKAKHLTVCPSCGITFGVTAKHMVRQHARCRPCIRKANGWTCLTCGSTDPHHPFPCPETLS